MITMGTVTTQLRPSSRGTTTSEAVHAAWGQLVERYQQRAVLALDAHLPRDTADDHVCIACEAAWPCPAVLAAAFALEL